MTKWTLNNTELTCVLRRDGGIAARADRGRAGECPAAEVQHRALGYHYLHHGFLRLSGTGSWQRNQEVGSSHINGTGSQRKGQWVS